MNPNEEHRIKLDSGDVLIAVHRSRIDGPGAPDMWWVAIRPRDLDPDHTYVEANVPANVARSILARAPSTDGAWGAIAEWGES